jgi:hypothetical protein
MNKIIAVAIPILISTLVLLSIFDVQTTNVTLISSHYTLVRDSSGHQYILDFQGLLIASSVNEPVLVTNDYGTGNATTWYCPAGTNIDVTTRYICGFFPLIEHLHINGNTTTMYYKNY